MRIETASVICKNQSFQHFNSKYLYAPRITNIWDIRFNGYAAQALLGKNNTVIVSLTYDMFVPSPAQHCYSSRSNSIVIGPFIKEQLLKWRQIIYILVQEVENRW